jgi:hypothetical protein
MPHRFLDLSSLADIKCIGAGLVAILSTVVDAAVAPPDSWESIGLKTMLVLAIVYLARELNRQREAHKLEWMAQRKDDKDAAAEREKKLIDVIAETNSALASNTAAQRELQKEAALQTAYFKTVAHTLLSRTARTKLPEEKPGD